MAIGEMGRELGSLLFGSAPPGNLAAYPLLASIISGLPPKGDKTYVALNAEVYEGRLRRFAELVRGFRRKYGSIELSGEEAFGKDAERLLLRFDEKRRQAALKEEEAWQAEIES